MKQLDIMLKAQWQTYGHQFIEYSCIIKNYAIALYWIIFQLGYSLNVFLGVLSLKLRFTKVAILEFEMENIHNWAMSDEIKLKVFERKKEKVWWTQN